MYDLLGVELPEEVKGYPQIPLEGVSFRSTFAGDDVPTPKETGFFSMLGSRAIWHKGWKAVSVHPTIAGWGDFGSDRWELYDTDEDPTESRDLAAEHPEKLQELINLWFHEAGLLQRLPAAGQDGRSRCSPTRPGRRSRRRATATSTTRTPPRCPRPRRSTSATAATPSRSRSTSTPRTPSGVLFSHGARFGGHALYVKDGKLKYVYNFVGDHEQIVESTRGDPDRPA